MYLRHVVDRLVKPACSRNDIRSSASARLLSFRHSYSKSAELSAMMGTARSLTALGLLAT